MKKKIFAYVGTRNPDSRLTNYVNRILNQLSQTNLEVEYDIYTAFDTSITPSIGCKNCFNKGICNLDNESEDMMGMLKEKMINADFIILASPVYSHNVSADMKAFVDRVSYWAHLMKLAGKPAVVIASAESNGSQQVLNYLEKISCYLGLSVIEKIGVVSIDNSSEENFDEYISNISSYLTGDKIVESNEKLETVFKTMKWIFGNYPEDHVEHLFWKNNGMLECETFQEVLDRNKVLAKINL